MGKGSTSEYLKIPGRGAALGQLGVTAWGAGVSHICWAALTPSLHWHPAGSAQKGSRVQVSGLPPVKDPAGAGTPSQENLPPGPYHPPPPSLPYSVLTSVLDHQPSSSLVDSWGAQGCCRAGVGRGFPMCPVQPGRQSLAPSCLPMPSRSCIPGAPHQETSTGLR